MSEGLNRVTLLGNLGATPELRFTNGGQAVLNLRLATTESYLDKDKVRKERTDWHTVVMWGPRGEALSKILDKGSSLLVEGRLNTSSYEDREGQKRYKTEVVATNVVLTGKGSGSRDDASDEKPRAYGAGNGAGRGAVAKPASGSAPDGFSYGSDDDIPFDSANSR